MISHLINSIFVELATAHPLLLYKKIIRVCIILIVDALVVRAIIMRNGLKCILVDNRNSINILFGAIYDKMLIDHKLIPMIATLYGFIGESIILKGRVTLVVDLGSPLEGSSLKELWVVTSIHNLCTKFRTEQGIPMVVGDQMGLREFYLNLLRKAEPRSVNMVLVVTKMLDAPVEGSIPKQGGRCQNDKRPLKQGLQAQD